MTILESILIAASLCADCFAVSMCSSVSLCRICKKQVGITAISFAIIQTALLLAGWAFGELFVGMVEKVSHIIGFGLLLYVGGGMLKEGIKNEKECRNLNGFRNIVLGGIATSIDALAVGVAQSMNNVRGLDILPLAISIFAVTALSVVCGMVWGKKLGDKFGRWAEIIGGIVLIGIGVGVLI